MDKGSEGIAATIFASENNWLSPQERSYDVRFSPQEDLGGTASEVGESKSCEEEGGVVPAGMAHRFFFCGQHSVAG
ncbi:MAG: hypothetical protein WAN21_22195 [Candidatus Sulfotelmatobacter sp.]|jgi:hypothetical protein